MRSINLIVFTLISSLYVFRLGGKIQFFKSQMKNTMLIHNFSFKKKVVWIFSHILIKGRVDFQFVSYFNQVIITFKITVHKILITKPKHNEI